MGLENQECCNKLYQPIKTNFCECDHVDATDLELQITSLLLAVKQAP